MRAALGTGQLRRRRDRVRESHGNSQRWVISYADFITLLFAFFTTLYAISTIDVAKFGSAATGLQSAFGASPAEPSGAGAIGAPPDRAAFVAGVEAGKAAPPGAPPMADGPELAAAIVPGAAPQVTLDDVRARLSGRLAGPIEDQQVAIEVDPRGLVVSIRESGSFATGSAEVTEEARRIIGEVAAAIGGIGNLVRIEGHTDDVPIHTARYASNWELSTARATNVVALLIAAHGIVPGRLSAAGYSEFHARVPNDSAANRARNRRVDIVILNPVVSRREEPAPSAARGAPPPPLFR